MWKQFENSINGKHVCVRSYVKEKEKEREGGREGEEREIRNETEGIYVIKLQLN